jgi:hypothetical protein
MTSNRLTARHAARLIALMGLIAICLPSVRARAQAKPKVAILPFAVSGDPELGSVGAHVPDMLASRLETRGNFSFTDIDPVRDTFTPEDLGLIPSPRASTLAHRLGVDDLVGGTLRSHGGSMHYEAQVFRRDGTPVGDRIVIPVKGTSDVLAELEPLADAIAACISGSGDASTASPKIPEK